MRVLARLGLFVAVSLLTRAPLLGVRFLDLDEAATLLGSWTLMRGGTLYVDFVDNRPPLLYALYALPQALGGHGLLAVRLFSALVVLPLTALLASAVFRHDRRGLVAGLLYLVYGAAFLAHDMHSVSAEILALLPLAAAAALVRDGEDMDRPSKLIGAGVLVGLAALVRQQAAVWLAALALLAWRPRDGARTGRVRREAAVGLGFGLPILLCGLAFATRGALPALVRWTLTHNLHYVRNPIPLAEVVERATSYLLPFLVATSPLWWATAKGGPAGRSHPERVAIVTLACSVPATFLGGRFFPHYFVLLYLPLALAAAPWTEALVRRPLSRAGRVALAWPLVALLGFTAANVWLYLGSSKVYEETRPVFSRVAARLRRDPCFGRGPLFVWGFAPQIYVEARLEPASRFVMPQASLAGYVPGNRALRSGRADTRDLVREEDRDRLMDDLERSHPAFVLDTAPSGLHGWDRYPMADFPRLARFVRRDYDAVADVDGVWVWRRRGCAR